MLEELAKYHKDWLRILYSFGCSYDDANDIVQDMYLDMHKYVKNYDRIKYKDTINKYYVYRTLKNLYLIKLRGDNKRFDFKEFMVSADEEYNIEDNDCMQVILDNIYDDIAELGIFESRLFELYYDLPLNDFVTYSDNDFSLRDISSKTNISLTTIHKTLKGIKDKLQERYSEDIEDYFNGDFSKVERKL